MNTWIALLRGINVGGNSIIKMDALRACVSHMGFDKVQTYIQTGNVLFQSQEPDTARLKVIIEKGIKSKFGINVAVIILSPAELLQVVKNCPPEWNMLDDSNKYYVTFLNSQPDLAKWAKLVAKQPPGESSTLNDRKIYTMITPEMTNSAFASNALEKKLGVTGTTRNWKVTNKLYDLARA